MENEERKLMAVEEYFGVAFSDLEPDDYEYKLMMRIQTDYENGSKDIEYYAAQYGYSRRG